MTSCGSCKICWRTAGCATRPRSSRGPSISCTRRRWRRRQPSSRSRGLRSGQKGARGTSPQRSSARSGRGTVGDVHLSTAKAADARRPRSSSSTTSTTGRAERSTTPPRSSSAVARTTSTRRCSTTAPHSLPPAVAAARRRHENRLAPGSGTRALMRFAAPNDSAGDPTFAAAAMDLTLNRVRRAGARWRRGAGRGRRGRARRGGRGRRAGRGSRGRRGRRRRSGTGRPRRPRRSAGAWRRC